MALSRSPNNTFIKMCENMSVVEEQNEVVRKENRMAGNKSVMKELHGLYRNASKLYDGQVEFCVDEEENKLDDEQDDSYLNVVFYVTPNDGLYKNARVKFRMRVDTMNYPDNPPEAYCLNNIYHPNIDIGVEDEEYGASTCVSLLGPDWQHEVGLDGAVMAILFLFYHPQLDDSLSEITSGLDDWDVFEKNVYTTLRGGEVDGYFFDKLIDDKTKDDGTLVAMANTEDTSVTVDDKNNSDRVLDVKLIGNEILENVKLTTLPENEQPFIHETASETERSDSEVAPQNPVTVIEKEQSADNISHASATENQQSDNVTNSTTNKKEESDNVTNSTTNKNEQADCVKNTKTNEHEQGHYNYNAMQNTAAEDVQIHTRETDQSHEPISFTSAAEGNATTCLLLSTTQLPALQRAQSREKPTKLVACKTWFLKLRDRLSLRYAHLRKKSFTK